MEKDKKYFWLKLKKDFFKRHDVMVIESMPNGKDYVLFYLKLLLESVDHEGALRFNDVIPYNENMLAAITNTNIDVVRSSMKLFIELKLIEIMSDETIFMKEIENMMGSETYWALKKRKQREIGNCPTNVLQASTMSKQEIDKDKELDKELEIDKEPPKSPKKKKRLETLAVQKHQYAEFVAMTNDEYQSLVDDERLGTHTAVNRCIEILDNYKGANGKKYKSDYRAILTWVIDRYEEERRRQKPNKENPQAEMARRAIEMLKNQQKGDEDNET